MAIADKSKIAIISGIAESSIDDLWITLADNWVEALLCRDMEAGLLSATDYLNMRTRNDFLVEYDGVRKFALNKYPVTSVTSVIANPDSDDPATLTADENYFANTEEGTIEFADGYDLNLGQRKYQINYQYGYSSVPSIVEDYANYWAAFMLESDPAKNADGALLREVTIGRYKEGYATASTALKAKYSILPALEALIIEKYKNWDC